MVREVVMALPSSFSTVSLTQCRRSNGAATRCNLQSLPPKKRGQAVIQKVLLRDTAVAPAMATESVVTPVPLTLPTLPTPLTPPAPTLPTLPTMPTTPTIPEPLEGECGGRNRMQEVLSAMLQAAESFIPLIEPRQRTLRTDPRIQLEGNFAPVEESPPRRVLDVEGTIPKCLNGAYVRNGGNPQFAPVAGYHNFDGDGMLHVVRIKDGEATHCCRFTRTNRYVHEKKAGRPIFAKALGELQGLGGLARLALFRLRGLAGVADLSKGMGAANAGVEYFNGMLLAMSEDDMPYAVRVTDNGDVETLGRYNFGGALKTAMTAHPKVDPKTGEMSAFSYDVQQRPYLTYFRVSPNGTKREDVPITLPEPTVMHDFAITENYAIFPEGQMVFRLQELFNGNSPILCDEKKIPRFGVLPRKARSESRMRWFDVPDATCFHYVNAWEEGEEILIVGSAIAPLPFLFDKPSDLQCRLCLFRLNLRTGKASKHQLSDANLDVGRCNTRLAGRKTRYAYMSISGPWPRYSGVAKVDLESGRMAGWREFAPGGFGSEPYFVSNDGGNSNDVAEDDGYVVTHFHNEITGESELLVLDAQSPTLDTVARIRMPSRVPYGFHGVFLTEDQLARQRSSLP